MSYTTEVLNQAINIMREFLDEAERRLNDSIGDDFEKATDVLHSFAWGFANASGKIETAFNSIHREYQIEKAVRE